MKPQPFGRWNRAHPSRHVVEKISDQGSGAEWGVCRTCDWQGELRTVPGMADKDCDEHERYVWMVAKAELRMIRGTIEQ